MDDIYCPPHIYPCVQIKLQWMNTAHATDFLINVHEENGRFFGPSVTRLTSDLRTSPCKDSDGWPIGVLLREV